MDGEGQGPECPSTEKVTCWKIIYSRVKSRLYEKELLQMDLPLIIYKRKLVIIHYE